MKKLNQKQVQDKMEEIIKKVFLQHQHKLMEVIAEEVGVKKEILYFAFAKNKQVRNEIMQILERHQNNILQKEMN